MGALWREAWQTTGGGLPGEVGLRPARAYEGDLALENTAVWGEDLKELPCSELSSLGWGWRPLTTHPPPARAHLGLHL